MKSFSFACLIESERAQNGCKDHPRTMDPCESFMQANRTTSFCSRDSGGANSIVSGNEIQISRHRAQGNMRVACDRTGVFPTGVDGKGQRGQQRNGSDQAEPLMHLQHMGALIEQRLLLAVSLRLLGGDTQILK